MTAEGSYRCFLDTCNKLKENRQQQRLLLKMNYLEKFNAGTSRMLEEKNNVLLWVIDNVQLPRVRDSEQNRTVVNDCQKDTLPFHDLTEDSDSNEHQLSILKNKKKAEN